MWIHKISLILKPARNNFDSGPSSSSQGKSYIFYIQAGAIMGWFIRKNDIERERERNIPEQGCIQQRNDNSVKKEKRVLPRVKETSEKG